MKKILETIDKWLENANRDYAEGLDIFEACATDTQKKEFGAFLKNADPKEQHQFSAPMTILTNKLVAVKQMMLIEPDKFKEVKLLVKTKNTDNVELSEKEAKIETLTAEIDTLRENLETSEDDNSELQAELDEKESELEELQAELDELKKKRGLQIVAVKDLPKPLQAKLDRNREITPLMASIHAEIANEAASEEKRKSLVEELCKLDDERRDNWDAIDAWSQGKEVTIEGADAKPEFDSDKVIAGIQIARRIERVKENLARSKKAVETAKTEKIRTNAENRIVAYETELKELEAMLPKTEISDAE